MACPDRLSQWTQEVSTAFAHLSKPQIAGLVLSRAGMALSGVAGIVQISASFRLHAARTGTNRVSAFTRVVSGRGAEEWEKAARLGGVHVFCSLASMGVTLVEKRKAPSTAGT